jgi:hypothetical protein
MKKVRGMAERGFSAAPAGVGAALLALGGCDRDGPDRAARGEAPPPVAGPAAPGVCGGPRRVNDATNLARLPARTGAFCIDPTGSDRGFGEGAREPLDRVCDLFDGECEIYKRHRVKRVVEARYVDDAGTGATIELYLSEFASAEAAYAMFGKRVVGDGDPAHADAPRPAEAPGALALGIGNATLWRGAHLGELVYVDGRLGIDLVKAHADAALPPLARALGAELPGATEPPAEVAALPAEERLPLGVRYHLGDVFGVPGSGPGAVGYYRAGAKRWRVIVALRADADQAKDALRTLARQPGAVGEKGIGDGAWRVPVGERGAPITEWLVARAGAKLAGVGDEPRVLVGGMSPEERAEKALDLADKRERLRKLLGFP